jgi:hypothetical protein
VYWRHRFVLEEEMNVRSGAAPQSDVIRWFIGEFDFSSLRKAIRYLPSQFGLANEVTISVRVRLSVMALYRNSYSNPCTYLLSTEDVSNF